MTALLLAAALAASPLQDAVERAMAGRAGAVVVLDTASGAVRASHRLDTAERLAVRPGSAVKPFVLATLLDLGKLNPHQPVFCPGELRIAGHRMDCTHTGVPEGLTAQLALAYSCNHYFARAAGLLRAEELAAGLRRYGFTVSAPEDLRLQALGESGVLATPLALAAAYRRLALRRGEVRLAPVFEGLEECARYGTGRLAAPSELAVAGKTGSAGHAWFAGWAPARRPERIVVVFLERGAGGSDAAPVARHIFAAAEDPGVVTVRVGARTVSLPLEEYVAGVLFGECGAFTSGEALKAMAVTARTWAARFRGRHRAEGFDFCETTHCQDYRAGRVPEKVLAAVRDTEGELLWYEGALAATYYSQNCGGTTEAAQYVWPELRAPYLRQQGDGYCLRRGRMEWHSEIRRTEMGGIASLAVVARTPSGRVARLSVSGKIMTAAALHLSVGRALGWDRLRSTNYEVHQEGDRFVFHGYGGGHGVGLCQAGAEQMGGEGKSYREILEFYYPGTRPGLTAQGIAWHRLGGGRVELWTTQPAEDQSLIPLAERLFAEAGRRAGHGTDLRPQLRVYPTVAMFRDSTGEPGSVAAVTRGRVIRMQPAAVLRSRGALESTLLHEFLHVLVPGGEGAVRALEEGGSSAVRVPTRRR